MAIPATVRTMTGGAGGFELVVLGAGPAFTDRIGATGAAYLLRHPDGNLLLDLGQGSFPRLAAASWSPATCRRSWSRICTPTTSSTSSRSATTCAGTWPGRAASGSWVRPGLRDRLDGLHAEAGLQRCDPGHRAARLGMLGASDRSTVEAALVAHTDESYGFRVASDDGPGLVYSGDCGRAEDLDPLIRPGDVLLCEVSFGAGPVPADACPPGRAGVGALAARTMAASVLLTHLLMDHDRSATIASVQARFDGPVRFVDPGDRIELPTTA